MLRDKIFISLCLGASLVTAQSWGMERENERKNSNPKLYFSVDFSLDSAEPLVIFTDKILQDGRDYDEGLVESEQDSKRAQANPRLVTELGEMEKVRKWLKETPFPEGIKNLIAGYVAAFPQAGSKKFSGYLQLRGSSSNLHQEVYRTLGDWAREIELLVDDKGRLVVQTKQGLKHILLSKRRYHNREAEIQKRNRKKSKICEPHQIEALAQLIKDSKMATMDPGNEVEAAAVADELAAKIANELKAHEFTLSVDEKSLYVRVLAQAIREFIENHKSQNITAVDLATLADHVSENIERFEIDKIFAFQGGKLKRSPGRNAGKPKVSGSIGCIRARLVMESHGKKQIDIATDGTSPSDRRPFSGWAFRLEGEIEDIDSTDELSLEEPGVREN